MIFQPFSQFITNGDVFPAFPAIPAFPAFPAFPAIVATLHSHQNLPLSSLQLPPTVTIIITATTICHYHHQNYHHLSLSSSKLPPSVAIIIKTTTICRYHHNYHQLILKIFLPNLTELIWRKSASTWKLPLLMASRAQFQNCCNCIVPNIRGTGTSKQLKNCTKNSSRRNGKDSRSLEKCSLPSIGRLIWRMEQKQGRKQNRSSSSSSVPNK